MTFTALLSHLLFGFILFLFSCGICWYFFKHPIVIDIPNNRSSHDTPMPNSGGIAIVITFLVGAIAIYLIADIVRTKEYFFLGFVGSALLIAVASFIDDLIGTKLFSRLFFQALAVIAAMASGIVINELRIPWIGNYQLGIVGYIITFLWIIGLTNAYNFMDGINGMAAGTAVIVCLFFGYVCFIHGSNFTYIISYTITAGSLGFLLFNFPHARLFMGDVGATFLGFVFACLAIIAYQYDFSHTSFFVMPLLLLHFIYDTFLTFLRRLYKRENVFTAHRSHLYQLFNKLGYSHTAVSFFSFGVCIAQGIGCLWMVSIMNTSRVLVFIPYLTFQVIYSIIITRKAKRAGILF